MTAFRIAEAAALLGVSEDTLRRWAEAGRLETIRLPSGRKGVDGVVLAELARSLGVPSDADRGAVGRVIAQSARNRFRGIVTTVTRDGVMAQVELACGPHRVVSLMSREAADELGLNPGVLAVAVVKSTNVVVEITGAP